MNTLNVKILFILLALHGSAFLHGKSPTEIWFDLAVKSQNVGFYYLQHEREGTYLHFEQVEPKISSIQKDFHRLKEIGEVDKITISMPAKFDDEKWAKMERFLNGLSDEFGRFLASEMLDVGVRVSILAYNPPENLTLTIFLPSKKMTEFKNLFEVTD